MLSEIGRWLHRFLRLLLNGSKPAYGALAVAALVAFLYFRVFFGGRSGFSDDADKASKMPLFDRDWDPVEEQWSTMKILLWISVSLGSGVLAYYQLPGWFPKWFR